MLLASKVASGSRTVYATKTPHLRAQEMKAHDAMDGTHPVGFPEFLGDDKGSYNSGNC